MTKKKSIQFDSSSYYKGGPCYSNYSFDCNNDYTIMTITGSKQSTGNKPET